MLHDFFGYLGRTLSHVGRFTFLVVLAGAYSRVRVAGRTSRSGLQNLEAQGFGAPCVQGGPATKRGCILCNPHFRGAARANLAPRGALITSTSVRHRSLLPNHVVGMPCQPRRHNASEAYAYRPHGQPFQSVWQGAAGLIGVVVADSLCCFRGPVASCHYVWSGPG